MSSQRVCFLRVLSAYDTPPELDAWVLRLPLRQVAERAREHPKTPGHQAMQKVLASTKERSEIEAEVKNKLLNVHSGYVPHTPTGVPRS